MTNKTSLSFAISGCQYNESKCLCKSKILVPEKFMVKKVNRIKNQVLMSLAAIENLADFVNIEGIGCNFSY